VDAEPEPAGLARRLRVRAAAERVDAARSGSAAARARSLAVREPAFVVLRAPPALDAAFFARLGAGSSGATYPAWALVRSVVVIVASAGS